MATIYYGGDLAKEVAERIVKQGNERGFDLAASDMENVKKTDFTQSQTAVFVIQVFNFNN